MPSTAQAWLIEQVERALATRAFERRTIFGCPTFFAHGRIFAVLWEGVRLVMKFTAPEDVRTLRARPGAGDWFPRRAGPPVDDAVIVPEAMHEDEDELALWLGRAHRQAIVEAQLGGTRPGRARKPPTSKPRRASRPSRR